MKTLIIGCDNAGVPFKNEIANHLRKLGYELLDLGVSESTDSTFYPCVARNVCDRVIQSGFQHKAILICGTGIGMSISANKHKGIRAAVCHDVYSTQRSVLSNDCNVMCMGARVIGIELAKVLVELWGSLEFAEGPSTSKVQEINNIEQMNFRK